MTHPAILETRAWHWASEADCAAWAQALAQAPGVGQALLTLHGSLGAGKTTLVRHLLRALGVSGRIKSPTYAVMEPYTLADGGAAAHFDFYRFNDPREWLDAGFRDVFAQAGLKLCEWPEKAEGLLPVPDLRLHLAPLDDAQRELQAQACTPAGQALLAALPPTPGAVPPGPPPGQAMQPGAATPLPAVVPSGRG